MAGQKTTKAPDSDAGEARRTRREDGSALHQREGFRQIWLPFALTGLLILVMLLIIALPSDPSWRTRVGLITDFITLIMIYCPLFICGFLVYALIVIGVFYANRLHDGTQKPLERAESIAAAFTDRVERTTESINERVVSASSRFAGWTTFMDFFDQPNSTSSNDAQEKVSDESENR